MVAPLLDDDSSLLQTVEDFPVEALVAQLAVKGGLSGFLCEAGYPSCVHEALVEHDGELCLRLSPLTRRAFPFRSGVVQDQV